MGQVHCVLLLGHCGRLICYLKSLLLTEYFFEFWRGEGKFKWILLFTGNLKYVYPAIVHLHNPWNHMGIVGLGCRLSGQLHTPVSLHPVMNLRYRPANSQGGSHNSCEDSTHMPLRVWTKLINKRKVSNVRLLRLILQRVKNILAYR